MYLFTVGFWTNPWNHSLFKSPQCRYEETESHKLENSLYSSPLPFWPPESSQHFILLFGLICTRLWALGAGTMSLFTCLHSAPFKGPWKTWFKWMNDQRKKSEKLILFWSICRVYLSWGPIEKDAKAEGTGEPTSKSWLCHLLAVCPWASHITSFGLAHTVRNIIRTPGVFWG